MSLKPTPTDGGWATWEKVYVTSSSSSGLGQSLRVELISAGQQPLFDNVRLEAIQIPEPSTLFLLAVAFLGIACHRRRRRCG
jgi:hypothetical protein